jgi:hypothetical protein
MQEPKAADLLSVILLRKKKDKKYKKYASFNRRIMAASIDTTIALFTLAPVVDFLLRMFNPTHDISFEQYQATQANPDTANSELMRLLVDSGKLTEMLISSTTQMLVLLIASAVCWKIWSATPGKMLLGMKIVDAASEKPISNRQILLRSLGYIISCSVFFMGILWISLDKRRQGWHDKIAGTTVVLTRHLKNEIDSEESATQDPG